MKILYAVFEIVIMELKLMMETLVLQKCRTNEVTRVAQSRMRTNPKFRMGILVRPCSLQV